jgi:DNA replication protein DnaC
VALADYVATFTRQFDGDASAVKSLYLYSATPGTGKTTTAAALINEWLAVHYIGSLRRGIAPTERPAYFLDINAWQTDYNAFNRPRVPEEIAAPAAARYYAAQRIALSVPFLVADDIGVRDATESFRADLHTVINARVAAELPTVYTSNIKLAELNTLFDRRLADRVRDMCVELTFVGESKRGMRNT